MLPTQVDTPGLQRILPKENTLSPLHSALCMETETVHMAVKHCKGLLRGGAESASLKVFKKADHRTQCCDFIDQVVFGQRLDLMSLEVFTNLNDSMILSTDSAIQFLATATNVATSLANIHHNYTQ